MSRFYGFMRLCILVISFTALNVFTGLKVMGLSYRSFSWMTLSEEGGLYSLYPVIYDIHYSDNQVSFAVLATPGVNVRLERTSSLYQPEWLTIDDRNVDSDEPVILLDPNPVNSSSFYRTR